ncbi:MAG TPA: gephyrin-like molybdotransferase Glp [Thermoanaerobaculia bacterium]
MGSFQRAREREEPITVEEAQRRVLAEISTMPPEEVALADAHGRVLREDIVAADDVPRADNSAMDGYAVRAGDVANAPVTLRVIADIGADADPDVTLTPGTAARIMTGASVPNGADAVVQVEHTDAGSANVRIDRVVKSGTNVRRRGEDMRRGEIVLRAGMVIGPGEVGVLSTARKERVRVGPRPSVAILATGDEIVSGRVANSNSQALAALTRDAGARPQLFAPIPDDREATKRAIEKALQHDVVITSGGVSHGAFDFVKDALDDLGAETKFWQVAMKPGKPVIFSRVRDRVVFGLPGNPVSCIVGFLLFVGPALRKMMGQTANLFLPVVNARAGAVVENRGDRRTYLRVRLAAVRGELVAYPMKAQGSGVSTSMVGANGLAYLEAGTTRIDTGSSLRVLVFGPILAHENGE